MLLCVSFETSLSLIIITIIDDDCSSHCAQRRRKERKTWNLYSYLSLRASPPPYALRYDYIAAGYMVSGWLCGRAVWPFVCLFDKCTYMWIYILLTYHDDDARDDDDGVFHIILRCPLFICNFPLTVHWNPKSKHS